MLEFFHERKMITRKRIATTPIQCYKDRRVQLLSCLLNNSIHISTSFHCVPSYPPCKPDISICTHKTKMARVIQAMSRYDNNVRKLKKEVWRPYCNHRKHICMKWVIHFYVSWLLLQKQSFEDLCGITQICRYANPKRIEGLVNFTDMYVEKKHIKCWTCIHKDLHVHEVTNSWIVEHKYTLHDNHIRCIHLQKCAHKNCDFSTIVDCPLKWGVPFSLSQIRSEGTKFVQ